MTIPPKRRTHTHAPMPQGTTHTRNKPLPPQPHPPQSRRYPPIQPRLTLSRGRHAHDADTKGARISRKRRAQGVETLSRTTSAALSHSRSRMCHSRPSPMPTSDSTRARHDAPANRDIRIAIPEDGKEGNLSRSPIVLTPFSGTHVHPLKTRATQILNSATQTSAWRSDAPA